MRKIFTYIAGCIAPAAAHIHRFVAAKEFQMFIGFPFLQRIGPLTIDNNG